MGTSTGTSESAGHWRIQRRNWRQGRGWLPSRCPGPRQHSRFRPRPRPAREQRRGKGPRDVVRSCLLEAGGFSQRRGHASVSSGFILTYTTSDTSGAGSAGCTERGGLGTRPEHPPTPHASPEGTQLRQDAAGATWSIRAWASGGVDRLRQLPGKWSRERFLEARPYSSQRSRGTRSFPGFSNFFLKHFLNRHKQNQIEQL